MKKLLLFLAMLIPMAASAYDFMVDGVAYNILSAADLTCVVTEGCVPDNGKLVIPATVNYKNRTLTVVGIGDGKGVADFQTITDLTIENGPTYIEGSAFVFQRIQKLWIPPSIKLIKSDGFGSNMGHYNSIGNWISEPFEVIIEDGEDALKGEQPTFFPYPFNKGIVTRLYLGRSIDDKLFHGLGSLEDLTIGDMVTSVLREGVSMSFYMSSLKKLTVGKKLEIVPNLQETSLDEIYMRSETPPLSEGFKDGTYVSATLYVPRGTKEVYENAPTWQNFWTIEEYDVKDNNPNIVQSGYAEYDSSRKTLTFKYGEKPEGDNVYDTENTTFDYNTPAPWVSNDLKYVVFDESYSEVRPKSTAFWFDGASNLYRITGIENLNTSEVTNMTRMFCGCHNLYMLDLSHFNTEKVWTMNGMFSVCENLVELDLSSFNTSSVIDMGYMFSACFSLTRLNISSFNTDKVVSMLLMFNGCSYLTQLDLRNFNTASVTRMDNMFSNCSRLRSIYVSDKWTTAKVTNGDNMFSNCFKLVGIAGTRYNEAHKGLDYARLDGGTGSPGYFDFLSNGKQIPCSYAEYNNETLTLTYKHGPMPDGKNVYWSDDDGEVLEKYYRWKEGDGYWSIPGLTYGLKTVVFDKSYADARPTDLSMLFAYRSTITSVEGLENLNTSETTKMGSMFSGCSGLTELDLSSLNTSNVTSMAGMFSGCNNLKTIYVGDQWSTEKVTSGNNMFKDCTSLVGGAGTVFDSGHDGVEYAHIDGGADNPGYFTKYEEITDYAIFDSETGTLTFKYGVKPEGENVYATIYDMAEYKQLYGFGFISPWYNDHGDELKTVIFDESYSIARPKSMEMWFTGASSLTTIIGLENLNTSEVENMSYLFEYCSSLTELDLSHFDTGNVTDMSGMFYKCNNLKTIYVGDQWSSENVTDGASMFYGCTSLVGGSGTVYDSEHTDHTYAHIDGGTENPGYFSKRASVQFDINNDSSLDAKDIVDLVDFIIGKNPKDVTKDSADVNSDGKVDIADVITLSNAIVNKSK